MINEQRHNSILEGETLDDFINRLIRYETEDGRLDFKKKLAIQKHKTKVMKKYRAATSHKTILKYTRELHAMGEFIG